MDDGDKSVWESRDSLWGDGPAVPRMKVESRSESILRWRSTPAGRRFEKRMLGVQMLALTAGCLGIVVNSHVLVALAAISHLSCGFIVAVDKRGWFIFSSCVTGFFALVLLGVAEISAASGNESLRSFRPFLLISEAPWPIQDPDFLTSGWFIMLVSYSVVIAGILGMFFGYFGCADELIDVKNRGSAV